MAYTGKNDEQDPRNLFPGAEQQDPGFAERIQRGIQMDFPNATPQNLGNALQAGASMTPAGQTLQAGQALISALFNGRDSRQPYPMTKSGGGAGPQPVGKPVSRNAADVLPLIPQNQPAGRDYLGEVKAKDRLFNAERDTPAQTPAQAAYVPPMRAVRTNPWKEEATGDTNIPVYNMLREDAAAGKYPDSMQNLAKHEQQMVAQIKAMLPGAGPKEVRSVMNTITNTVRRQEQPSTAGPQTMSGAVNAATAEKPVYQKLGAGQSIYQMNPDGNAKLITTAPGGASEREGSKNFNNQVQNSMKMYAPIKKEYNAAWDKITEEIPDGKERELALRDLNTRHFKSLGVPDELASIPVSFQSWLDDQRNPKQVEGATPTQPTIPKTLTREQTRQYAQIHKKLVANRNQFLNRFWGNTLQSGGRGGTQ